MTVEVFGSVEIVDKCGDGSLMRQLLLCSFDSIATWVTLTLHLGIEQGVQRLLDGASHHPLEVALDPLVVNRDDVESTSSSARFGTASPTLLRERFCTSFVCGRRTFFILRRLVFEPPRFDVASEAASLAGEVTPHWADGQSCPR